jgi:hypothetical protein
MLDFTIELDRLDVAGIGLRAKTNPAIVLGLDAK